MKKEALLAIFGRWCWLERRFTVQSSRFHDRIGMHGLGPIANKVFDQFLDL